MKTIRLAEESPRILHQDDWLLVVYKPAGLDVFPSHRGRRNSLLSWLTEKMPALGKVGDSSNPSVVHRLDRHTSGIMLAACHDEAYSWLRDAFCRKDVVKEYIALVEGVIEHDAKIEVPLGARYRRSKKMSVALPGKRLRGVLPASTLVMPLGVARDMTLCRIQALSGLRHQVRIHLGHLGHPIAHDVLYGAKKSFPILGDRFFLHAWKIRFHHPRDGTIREYVCPLTDELEQTCKLLGLYVP